VIISNSKRVINRLLFLFVLGTSLWVIFNLMANLAVTDQADLFWSRLTIVPATMVAYVFVLFSHYFPVKTPIRRFAHIIYVLPLILSIVFEPTNYNASSITAGQTNLAVGAAYYFLVAYYFVAFISGTLRLWRTHNHSRGLQRAQIRYILAGVVFTVAPTLLFSGILPLFGINQLLSISPSAALIFVALASIAIFRHRLLEVRFVVARSLAYLLLLTVLISIYSGIIFGLTQLIFHGSTMSQAQNLTYIILSVVVAFSVQPMRGFFDRITDRIFYRDHYDSEVVLNSFSKIIVSELDLNRVLKRTITELCEKLHIQFAQLVVFNNERVYRVEHYGTLPKRLMVAPELARLDAPMIVADELEGGERKHLMERHGLRLSMSLRTREDFVGYLLLGDKLSGDIYSSQDIELLEIIGKELAVAISNAKAYAQIQEFNLTLQARVDHATNRLRVANRHLKELDHAKDEFISMASHQLRTPLTTIKGYLSMMLEGDAGKLNKAQTEFVDYAFGSSERMVNLISDLLNVSRLSAGRFLIQTKPTDMVQMISEEVHQLQTHASAKHIKLIFEPPPEPLPPAEIDDNKTRQVVMNFIDNAIYYTQVGEVRVVLEQHADKVRLEVRDTGIGVPENARKKLFSKFYRADNAQTIRPDGTGLGLYLAKRVVEDQGGTIIFSSVEGKGSTFGFELPLKPITQPHEVANHARHKSSR